MEELKKLLGDDKFKDQKKALEELKKLMDDKDYKAMKEKAQKHAKGCC